MLKVTNDQFQEILKSEADLYWEKVFALPKEINKEKLDELKGQYWKEMDNKLDQYEIIPFNVNTLSEGLARLINKLCSTEEQKNPCCKIYRGSIRDDALWWKMINNIGINETIRGGDWYNQTYCNRKLLATAHYCEGDVSFTVHSTEKSYNQEVIETEKFYKENN